MLKADSRAPCCWTSSTRRQDDSPFERGRSTRRTRDGTGTAVLASSTAAARRQPACTDSRGTHQQSLTGQTGGRGGLPIATGRSTRAILARRGRRRGPLC
jgi:hypothetical protein